MKVQVGHESAGASKNCRFSKNVQVLQVLLVGLLLAGCAGKVEPEIRTVRVEVPVQVPCRAPVVAVPPWAAAGLQKDDSLEVKVRALLAERLQHIGYEKELVAANRSCQ